MNARLHPRDLARTPELRRLIVQALGRCDWSFAVLTRIAGEIESAATPDGAEGAVHGVQRALRGTGNLRLQLLGALAVPGWSEAALRGIGEALMTVAPAFEGEELTAMRNALRGAR